MSNTEPMVWFAMRATYGRNLEAKKMLDETGVESYIPMHHVISLGKGGRKIKKYVPVVRDLVFVRTTKDGMLSIKESVDYLRNIYIPTAEGKKQIVVVPDQQMDSFMMVAGAQNEGIMYFSPDEINVAKGTKVRIYYDGMIAETYPAQIRDAYDIILLSELSDTSGKVPTTRAYVPTTIAYGTE